MLTAMPDTYEIIASIVEDSLEALLINNPCPITAATYTTILADLFATLVMSNSKSFTCHSHYVLRTTVGEQAESFLMSILAMEQEIKAKRSIVDLQISHLRRYITLAMYVHTLKSRPQRNASSETSPHLSQADITALQTVDLALQQMSDEHDLAVLRFCSARELRLASDITQCSDATVQTSSKNRRQSDYTLALQGYALGERFVLNTANTEIQAWIRLLSEAGAEYSVSLSSWCTDDWLTLDTRIFVLGQLQSSR